VALLTHCGRGQEVILGDTSHIYLNEVGGMAALAGLQACPVPNQPDGTLRLRDIENAIRSEDVHHPRTGLVCLENTQNICGGVPLTAAYTRHVADLAHARGLKLHLDGARLFNAAVAQGVSAAELAAPADSVMFCLSKGLSSPVGSMLCGPRAFIAEARRYRKQVGGGMRQAGVIAAAGIVSLETMVERLDDDHENARRLSEGLGTLPGIRLVHPVPASNMVYFSLAPDAPVSPSVLVRRMRKQGVVLDDGGPDFRLVTHAWVSAGDIEATIEALRSVMSS
jgi:threonine aldolase